MAPRPRELTPDRSARDLYGAEVRRLRVAADMSLARLAEVLKYSKSHLARIETADAMPPPGLSETLDAAFGTDGHLLRLYGLARREAHPDKYRRYMDCESGADVIEHWAGHLVPGLLQTEEYARALLRAGDPAAEAGLIEERVSARLSRQERLRGDNPPDMWAILDESVIRRLIGGPDVTLGQLKALSLLMDTAHSKVQILPYSHGAHRLLGGSLTLLTLRDTTVVAYEEGIDASHLYEDSASVRERRRAYDALRAYALSPKESAALISSAMEGCTSCEPLST
ncbi:helix-turn-helix domain-containing protein [Streptomyces sp. bgisy100]|uniref:helix-turn-helix domain-containing protein n=1 Tax=Streptomyces sp. bgisy100 TaxID=3413783 RepID=UPI003D72AD90